MEEEQGTRLHHFGDNETPSFHLGVFLYCFMNLFSTPTAQKRRKEKGRRILRGDTQKNEALSAAKHLLTCGDCGYDGVFNLRIKPTAVLA
jgi:hypothetical protein